MDDSTRQPAQPAPGQSADPPTGVNRLLSLAVGAAFKAPPPVPGYHSRAIGSYPPPQPVDFMKDGLALLADMRAALGREKANVFWKAIGLEKPGRKKGSQSFPDIDQKMIEIFDSVRSGALLPDMQHKPREVIARAIATDMFQHLGTEAGQSIAAITRRLVRTIREREISASRAAELSQTFIPNALLGASGPSRATPKTKIER